MKNGKYLTSILHSKRAYLYYIEYARILQKDGRVVFLKEDVGDDILFFNVPIANTSVLLLGIGTSITHAAMRMLASARVPVAFVGSGGTPNLMSSDSSFDMISPSGEYRPTKYMQSWCEFWFDESKRLVIAKKMQTIRIENIRREYKKDLLFSIDVIDEFCNDYISQINNASSIQDLFSVEGDRTKKIYRLFSKKYGISEFTRDHNSDEGLNGLLTHANYLAYGLASTTLWTLGIPSGLAVMHGKTRAGGLIFDVADMIKDSVVLPIAMESNFLSLSHAEMRLKLIVKFSDEDTLTQLFQHVKELSQYFNKDEASI